MAAETDMFASQDGNKRCPAGQNRCGTRPDTYSQSVQNPFHQAVVRSAHILSGRNNPNWRHIQLGCRIPRWQGRGRSRNHRVQDPSRAAGRVPFEPILHVTAIGHEPTAVTSTFTLPDHHLSSILLINSNPNPTLSPWQPRSYAAHYIASP